MMGFFSDRDRRLIEALRYDSTLEPSFECLKGCLVWWDERPDGLTPEGYDRLCNLWIARSYLHRGLPMSSYPISPGFLESEWNQALQDGVRWPGFQRLTLSPKDMEYYEAAMREFEESGGF